MSVINTIRRRWLQARLTFPVWTLGFIRYGLLREASNELETADSRSLSGILTALDYEMTPEDLLEIQGDFAIGAEHLDDIVRRIDVSRSKEIEKRGISDMSEEEVEALFQEWWRYY